MTQTRMNNLITLHVHKQRTDALDLKAIAKEFTQYLTLYSVNMTCNLKKSIIQWESVCICICLRPRRGSLSAQSVVLHCKKRTTKVRVWKVLISVV